MAEVVVRNIDGVLAEVRDLAQALVAPGAAEIDRESRFPDLHLRALAQIGALGLLVPREQGGVGGGQVALADACEAVGGACASTGMVFLMHGVTAATVAGGGGRSAARLLEDMASGEVLGTLAFSERGTGAHFYAPELRAERRDGSVYVSGRKAFVTSGGHADAMLVLLQGRAKALTAMWCARMLLGSVLRGVLGGPLPPREASPPLRQGELHTGDWRGGGLPPEPDPDAGFAPLGAVRETGAPTHHWRLSRRDAIWADDVGELVDQASAQQWDASRDIPWEAAQGLDDTTERAVAQVMTFLAQNEYAALYVPAGFLPQVNPQLVELVLWLGSHIHDEARHIEVFTKRSLAGGHHGYALASTELSLGTLLDEHDFTASSLLLNVLGEGTFLDLLRFIENHAPDAATAAAARLAHRDERRHVHFGISNIKRAVAIDPDAVGPLVAAAEARAAKLISLSGLSPNLM